MVLSAAALHSQEAPAPRVPRSPDGKPIPAYPRMLLSAGVEGEVRVRVSVDWLGRPIPEALVTLGDAHPWLKRAARDAVRRWYFAPGNGSVEVRIIFAIDRSTSGQCRGDAVPGYPGKSSYEYDPVTATARLSHCTVAIRLRLSPLVLPPGGASAAAQRWY
ncbi:MAG: TonB family protein [Gemmatimonadaceae bacterium]